MRCAVGLSTQSQSDAAFAEVVERLGTRAEGDGDDLAVIFSSPHHADCLDRFSQALTERGLGRNVIGCTGESIIGEDREIEGQPALSIWTARLPGTSIGPLEFPPSEGVFPTLPETNATTLLLLADPFTFSADRWFKELAAKGSKLRVVGGMASGSQVPGRNRFVLNGKVVKSGGVGVLLSGGVAIRTVVSQGCRPIGKPLIVTKAEQNLIRELGRRPALDVLRELFQELDEDDRERVQAGLHIGRVINEYQESFGRGDFLVRNVMGVDDSGAVAITDLAKVGQTVQFHVRDAETATEDLRALLTEARIDHPKNRVGGALIFSCNGRGTRLFEVANHDVGVVREVLGPIPLAGFFAMGELGPVGGENFVHGFTASNVLFEEPFEPDKASADSLEKSSS